MLQRRLAGLMLLLLSPVGLAQVQAGGNPTEPHSAPATATTHYTAKRIPPNPAANHETETSVDTGLDSSPHKLPSVRELLALMAKRQREANYQGTFTYQNNAGTESFQVQHWVQEGTEYQRLFYLNGPEREAVMRHSTGCQTRAERLIAGNLDGLQQNFTSLDRLYSFTVRGVERVAGRVATVLQITPRDTLRFGYLLSVDRQTGLVLKTVLIDESQRAVEQFQFISLRAGLDAQAFTAESAAHVTHKVNADTVIGCDRPLLAAPSAWQLQWQPPGFAFAGERTVHSGTQMLTYTDGLSTFSVFLDPVEGKLVIEGRAQRGATNFYMQGLTRGPQTYQVTVVGEVPLAVAEKVAQSIAVGQSNTAPSGG